MLAGDIKNLLPMKSPFLTNQFSGEYEICLYETKEQMNIQDLFGNKPSPENNIQNANNDFDRSGSNTQISGKTKRHNCLDNVHYTTINSWRKE